MNNFDRIFTDFSSLDISDLKLPNIVVYNNKTVDYKGLFVARLFDTNLPTDCVVLKTSLEAIREIIPNGMIRMARHLTDDPIIMETWL